MDDEMMLAEMDAGRVAALLKEASELPDTSRSLWEHNERELIDFCKRLAAALADRDQRLAAMTAERDEIVVMWREVLARARRAEAALTVIETEQAAALQARPASGVKVTDEMVEAAARVLAVEDGQDPDGLDPMIICNGYNEPLPLWVAHQDHARAALEAALAAQPAPVGVPDGVDMAYVVSLERQLAGARAYIEALPASPTPPSVQPSPVATGWMSISTAPKDGADILAWLPADEETGYIAHAEIVMCCGGHLEPRDTIGAMADGIEPTHWQPLPAPPS